MNLKRHSKFGGLAAGGLALLLALAAPRFRLRRRSPRPSGRRRPPNRR